MKNTLATVQSIASNSMQTAGSLTAARDDSGDRSEVVGIGGVPQAEQDGCERDEP